MIVAIAAVCVVSGCQKYDDSDLRKQIQELREKLSSLEAWCNSSQSAIDAVAVLQKAVENMNSVESIDPFIDADGATGYVITFTNKKTIKLYNGQNGKDGDAFFGNVVVKDDCIIFTLKDGSTFTVPRKQDDNDYLAFEAVEAGATVSLEIIGEVDAPSLKYSTNKLDWIDFDFSNPVTITLENVGDRVYWRNAGKADHFSKDADNYVHFVLGDKKIAASGNVMSLVDSSCVSLIIPTDWCFKALFHECASLTKAPELPAKELKEWCYSRMFESCSSLTEAPDIPATKLEYSSYFSMFRKCTSLKKAPVLPAKQLDTLCYQQMFAQCSSLEKAPELPATELAPACYYSMFLYCSSLREAPALPATELSQQCYDQMFAGCSSLIKAPNLPARELKGACYRFMFSETAIVEAPALPATSLASQCYLAMFKDCAMLKKAPELPATKMYANCYQQMFNRCESLEKAPELTATELEPYCYHLMFAGCKSLLKTPKLPATELAEGCYWSMFEQCPSLETAPELPAKTLSFGCYYAMFMNCTSLTEAPELPATKLAGECYCDMFAFTGLKKAPELPATELVNYCYDYMFEGCKYLEEAPYLPAKKLYPGCYEGLFENCINLKHIMVGFEDWGNGSATADWVAGVGTEGAFECPDGLEVKYGVGYIPTGWSVNGAAPVATKSFAAPATKSVSRGLRKAFAPKTLEIQDSPVRHELIAL